jgi:hypothetical protein
MPRPRFSENDKEFLTMLVHHGVDVNYPGDGYRLGSMTTLSIGLAYENIHLMAFLLQHGLHLFSPWVRYVFQDLPHYMKPTKEFQDQVFGITSCITMMLVLRRMEMKYANVYANVNIVRELKSFLM